MPFSASILENPAVASSTATRRFFAFCSTVVHPVIVKRAAMLASAAVLSQLVLALAASLSLVVANADAKLSSENGHAGSSRMSIKLRSPSSHAVSAARRDQIVDYKRLGVNQNPFNLAAQNITWSTTPFNPTGIPLAVRSPYVSTWLWGGTHDRFGDLTAQQPSFWNGNSLPWCGTVMVDGIVYTWMGVPAQCAPGGRAAVQESLSFTASQTVFSFTAGAVNVCTLQYFVDPAKAKSCRNPQVTATFLSPLTPTDLVRQSLPYSYLNVSVTSIDGQAHSVQMYTDITGEWASNDWTRTIQWGNSVLNNTLQVHHFQLTDPVLYGEAADSCLYGQVVYATYMVGFDCQNRRFGYLPNTKAGCQYDIPVWAKFQLETSFCNPGPPLEYPRHDLPSDR